MCARQEVVPQRHWFLGTDERTARTPSRPKYCLPEVLGRRITVRSGSSLVAIVVFVSWSIVVGVSAAIVVSIVIPAVRWGWVSGITVVGTATT